MAPIEEILPDGCALMVHNWCIPSANHLMVQRDVISAIVLQEDINLLCNYVGNCTVSVMS